MAKFALLLEYNGSNYHGWQIQRGVATIQGELERALSSFAAEKIATITAGRTDTGVHATHQVVHFNSGAKRQLAGWISGVNAKLAKDIRVKAAVSVDDDFNARYSATSRSYHYYLLTQPLNSALLAPQVGWYYQALDLGKMQQAASLLCGCHDFSAFRAAGCQANTPVREMFELKIEQRGNMLRFSLRANAFLHHMVRNIIGALVFVGNGRLSLGDFAAIFKAAQRSLAPPTFMANGLYLVNVSYPQSPFVSAATDLWLFNA